MSLQQRITVKQPTCSNCGIYGHHYRACIAPVTSYGVIAFRISDESWNQARLLSRQEHDLNGLPEKSIEFLLIQRRDSIGFIELIRAKYKLTDLPYICEQISGTTEKERQLLLTKSFHDLWIDLWGPMNYGENKQYKQEYEQARIKFEALKQGFEVDGVFYTLQSLLDTMPTQWDTPEWGFPKGRRNVYENDQQCAMREFQEETGLLPSQYRIFENIEPIRETFFGNNKIHYCHIYYLAWIPYTVKLKMNPKSEIMIREVGNIGWFSIESSLRQIRSTNLEKREILLRASSLLKNLCPMLVGPVASTAAVAGTFEQKEDTLFNRNLTHVAAAATNDGGGEQLHKSGGGSGGGSGGATGTTGSTTRRISHPTSTTSDDSNQWTQVRAKSTAHSNLTTGNFKFVED